MKRRTFLKALAVSPIAPGVLCAKETLKFIEYPDINYLNHLRRLEIMAAQRAAYPAMMIYPDGGIEPIKNEYFWNQSLTIK